jgi:CBS domain-containing protein
LSSILNIKPTRSVNRRSFASFAFPFFSGYVDSLAVVDRIYHDIGRLPVVGEGKIIGIINRSDAMLYFYDLLPD